METSDRGGVLTGILPGKSSYVACLSRGMHHFCLEAEGHAVIVESDESERDLYSFGLLLKQQQMTGCMAHIFQPRVKTAILLI